MMSHIRTRAAAAALAALLVAGCGGEESEAVAAADAVVSVGAESIVAARSEALSSGPLISGTLEAERAATVRAQIGGTVLETYAEEGQAVREGALLARLTDDAVRDAYLSAQSGVRSAENALRVAEREAERAERLVAGGALAQRDLENARSALAAAQAQAADARARLAAAEEQVQNTRITAPLSGVVSQRAVNAGDVVAPGAALFTVIDPGSMQLVASLPSEQVSAVQVGAPVEFRVRGYPGRTFQGRVQRINPAADPVTRQVPVYVAIPNEGGALVAGLFAEGQLQTSTRRATVIPLEAVDQTGATPTVLRLQGGVAQPVAVRLGARDPTTERVEVLAGVAAGDTVLVGAARSITPGTRVRIGRPASPAAAAAAGD